MDIFDVISLLGGLAMFLYGMRLMGDSLKENSSGALKRAMEKVTNNPFKAFLLGIFITALIQSSTATIVITAGLVGAGILTLRQSLGIIIGANVGTTVTGQIIRLLDVDASGAAWLRFFQPSTLAPIALIIGIVLIMGHFVKNSKSIGNIAIGFGILFSGLLNMTGSVAKLTQSGAIEQLFAGLGENPFLGYLTGAGVAFVLQSSSATVGILQAFSASGLLAFKGIYAVIVGIYLGDCVTTAIVCSIGANAESRRVGIVNILFNLSETVLVLVVVTVVHRLGLLDGLWERTVNSGMIANTNTIFNLGCSICLFPMLTTYEKLSRRIVKDEPGPEREEKYRDELEALNPSFVNTPALALQSCYHLLLTLFGAARENIEKAFGLLEQFDEGAYREILAEEENIDHLTDCCSRYLVEVLPHLQLDNHVQILNQYYKVTAEFERLGDHAVGIADVAAGMVQSGTSFSRAAMRELHVVEDALREILELTEHTFHSRSEKSARKIEPLVQTVNELSTVLRRNHLRRLSLGQCNMYADSSFSNLGVEFRRIAAVCSNVGVATVVRIHPELADHEHLYFESLHRGDDVEFNEACEAAHARYFRRLEDLEHAEQAQQSAPKPTQA
ncbi:MAG: Na/Pi cotransporter family protein [Oscillospiraceae bacterium]|nr:Na/Pi cotransporter family protein [Oscillospiraceae bacterium]